MKTVMSVLLLLFALTNISWAMPPLEGIKEPEALKAMRLKGMDSPKRGLERELSIKSKDAKISGSRSYPVILGYFTNLAAINTQAQFQAMLFNRGTGVKSVNNYYRDMSYNAMSCSGKVDNWRTSNNTVAYYSVNDGLNGGTTGNTYEFIRRVLANADVFINFADPNYDMDHDGYVDVLWVVHAGKGAEEGAAAIWSHSFYLSGFGGGATYYTTGDISPYTGTAVRINDYIINPERTNYADGNNTTTEMIGAGVYCHEFGHALGLPDLYNTASGGPGIGNWSIMAGGSWGGNGNTGATPVQMDVWCKRFLGWITPLNITKNQGFSFSATLSDSHHTTARLSKLGSMATSQFWLIEDRRSVATGPVSGVAWDQYIYSSGLAIYHIDSTYTTTTYLNANTVNASNTRAYGVALEETDQTSASYTSELYNGNNSGDAADMWNSTTQANFDSLGTAYPVTYLNNGTSRSGIAVRKIPAAGKGGDFSKAMFCTLYVIPGQPPVQAVELSYFTGMISNHKPFLAWRTESEHYCSHWEISRTKDSEEEYKLLAKIPGSLTSNQPQEYSYADESLTEGGSYYYLLTEVDVNGEKTPYGPVNIVVSSLVKRSELALLPCYPNPSRGEITFKYSLPAEGNVNIKVFNILGQEVRNVHNDRSPAGANIVPWDGKDNQGRILPNGVYVYQLVSGNQRITRKMTILK
ncbi:MAG: M6 family metalloprotease domain-containing protein [Candidatus Edwardsbacteria bacterium]|nr:M6 family metalloprotease domain-containing protein [Candidatus Edwardsbacteria bacterium]MBU1575630.1 M6 family metalloprotease domain-containing protein [Candidatus Edwardsbacteria bacterium]MBU2463000.1 M6 family metalloprotease domain-containing protein [Candidatus Edwardsbacteria bacterium]MBU2594589.1 M6 family metalloprotease domain-containing protein [Candidatus Edwardsbacteria bacterium]